ncbi:transglutaminase domain-containing protein [Chloroflexota bacterium]
MGIKKVLVTIVLILVLGLVTVAPVLAMPSQGFYERGADVYDSFGICRTRSVDEDGYMQVTSDSFDPVIARESLGENIDVAWEVGEAFADKYPESNQRAREIFYFVRDRVVYVPDIESSGYDEFAQNADELAGAILDNGTVAGDCEDMAVLLAVLYKAAGFRSAVVLVPGHAAALVHLPEYNRAGRVFTLEGEKGWIWAEATGSTNDLGWCAPSFIGEPMFAREVSEEAVSRTGLTYELTSVQQASSTRGFSFGGISPFFSIVFVLWMLSAVRRRPGRRVARVRRYRK